MSSATARLGAPLPAHNAAGNQVIHLQAATHVAGREPIEAGEDEFHRRAEIGPVLKHSNALVERPSDDAVHGEIKLLNRLL